MKIKQQPDITVLANDAVKEYLSVLQDWIVEKRIDASAKCTYITQFMKMDGTYIGAWLMVTGPLVPKSSGPEFSFAKWLWISADWETELLFDNIGAMFTYLISQGVVLAKRRPFMLGSSGRFEEQGVSTFDGSRWKGAE